jgi:hypothetical protein
MPTWLKARFMVLKKTRSPGWRSFAIDQLGGGRLLVGAARQDQANRLLEHGAHKAAAVKPGFYRIATAPVGHTKKAHGGDHQIRGPVSDRMADAVQTAQQPVVGHESAHLVVGRRMGRGLRGGAQQGEEAEPAGHGVGGYRVKNEKSSEVMRLSD